MIFLPWFHLPMKFSLFHSLLMFTVGLSFGLNKVKQSCSHPICWCVVALMLWLSLLFARIICSEYEFLVWPLRAYSAVLLVLGIWLFSTQIEFHRELPQIFRISFWVYCFHALAIRLLPLPVAATVPTACANGLIVFGVSCILGLFGLKYFPRLYITLTGNRF